VTRFVEADFSVEVGVAVGVEVGVVVEVPAFDAELDVLWVTLAVVDGVDVSGGSVFDEEGVAVSTELVTWVVVDAGSVTCVV
jgi:hypothetical protein